MPKLFRGRPTNVGYQRIQKKRKLGQPSEAIQRSVIPSRWTNFIRDSKLRRIGRRQE